MRLIGGITAAQRGFARLDGAQADVLRREGADDVTAALEEVGLAAKTGWYASILLYGAGGIATAGLYLLMPTSIPFGVFVLALVAVLLSILSVFGAIYLTNANWATHMRLSLGLGIFLVGAVVAGPTAVAFVLLPLFVLVTPSFLYGARFAAPYMVVVSVVTLTVLLKLEGPARLAHAWITVGAELMIVMSFIVAEQATRRLARLNRALAYTDPLTGIANMRRLRERLADALGRSGDEPTSFALFAIDLDNFKQVNDEYDHSVGDRVLRAVAAELSAEAGAFDLVARRGGDEFSVLVTEPDRRDVEALARRFSSAIVRARMRTCPQITPSGSVAYVPARDGDSTASILQKADDALHDVKTAFHTGSVDRTSSMRALEAEEARVAFISQSPRRASLDRVAAAVNRAYSPRRTGVEIERSIGRFRRWWSELNPMWSFSAVALTPAGFSLIVLSLAGQLHPLPTAVGLICGLGYYVLAGFGLWAAGHGWAERVMHLGFIVATLLTTWATWAAGPAGTAIIDILPVLVLYAIYFLGPRDALPYIFVLMTIYCAFAIGGDFAYGGLRGGITTTVVLVLAALVAKVRSVTVRFARTNAELSELDPLTGVANVRALGFRVTDAVAAASREQTVPAIVTIDLDQFKLVNDRYSHTVGDGMIESVARAISETVRSQELVARRGGDEFFVLFEHAEEDHIGAVIERLYDSIGHTRRRICPDLPSSSSIGVVTWREGESADEFLQRADRAMHDEKTRSRRRADRRLA
ncbi:MAG: GGDEF domain-containing protein [Actinobacteria bacterium]|nr:GGDEF domain-containing protein [Actinomycetota bacterium]